MLASLDKYDVLLVASLEAPLTVCEDFIVWAAPVLFSVAASRGHWRRMLLVVAVGLMCLTTEIFLLAEWVPYGTSTFLRPFFFHIAVVFWWLLGWQILTAMVSLAEVFSGIAIAAAAGLGILADVEPGRGRWPRLGVLPPGRFSSRLSGILAFMGVVGSIWVKYGWLHAPHAYPEYQYASLRFVPRSHAGLLDLDQAITAVGGILTLSFSLRDAMSERKKARQRA